MLGSFVMTTKIDKDKNIQNRMIKQKQEENLKQITTKSFIRFLLLKHENTLLSWLKSENYLQNQSVWDKQKKWALYKSFLSKLKCWLENKVSNIASAYEIIIRLL